ncbi:MAG: hypothetical protein WCG85_27640, partial [Polyangia bacterium]
ATAGGSRNYVTANRGQCPSGLRGKVAGEIWSTRDLILERIVRGVRERVVNDHHGKRFGNPVLDAARELVRYANPAQHGGGRSHHVGRQIVEETKVLLLEAMGLAD